MPASQIATIHTKRQDVIRTLHELAHNWQGDAVSLAHRALGITGVSTGPLVDTRVVEIATDWAEVALECQETQRKAEDAGEPLRGLRIGPDPVLAGRVRKVLARRYRFDQGVMSLGDFLASVTLTRRSLYVRHYARHKRNGCYAQLKTPRREYTVWYSDGSGEHGLDIPKIIYDALDLPAEEREQSHN